MHLPQNERFNPNLFLTTSEAGDLVGLHASSIKRLCDAGDLPHTSTEGGHRRIHLKDALDLARDRGNQTFLDPFAPYEGHVWSALRAAEEGGSFERIRSLAYSWLLMERHDLLRSLLRSTARRSGIPYPVFLDQVLREFMRDVGSGWREGRMGVAAEHEATEIVIDCLHGLREEWSAGPDERSGGELVAVVGGLEKNRHDLGPLSIRLLLERAGWDVIYLGADVPLEEIAEIQILRGARLVCLSVGAVDGRAGAARALRLLALLYRPDHPYDLALGGEELSGSGWIPGSLPFESIGVFSGAREFEAWLEERSEGDLRDSEESSSGPARRPEPAPEPDADPVHPEVEE